MGGDFRQVGGDFLAKALDPEGPPPAQKTLEGGHFGQVSRLVGIVLESEEIYGGRKAAS